MNNAVAQTQVAGIGIGSIALFGGWVLGGSLPGREPLSQTASALVGHWVQGIQTAVTAFQGMGMSPDMASLTACAAGLLAPVAAGIVISNTGRMAIKLAQAGVRQFWDNLLGRTGDDKLRREIEAAFGKVAAAFAGHSPFSPNGGIYYVRTEDGKFHPVDKETYLAFRKDILKDESAVVIADERILNYEGGKLASVAYAVRDYFGRDVPCEFVVKNPQTNDKTRTSLADLGANRGGFEPTMDASPQGLRI